MLKRSYTLILQLHFQALAKRRHQFCYKKEQFTYANEDQLLDNCFKKEQKLMTPS